MNIVELLKKGINNINTICAKYINEDNEIEYLPIFYIAGSQTLPPPLEQKEEEELIRKLSEEDKKNTSGGSLGCGGGCGGGCIGGCGGGCL
mgnify:CR=1 FL=1